MRTASRRHPWLWTIALLLLVSLGVGAAQELAHTDDGCAVEIHCLACRTAATRADAPAALPTLLPVLVPVARVVASAPRERALAQPDAAESRGPPSLS